MTLFSIALLGEHPVTVSLSGMARNLLWVTIGNIVRAACSWRLATGFIPAAKRSTTRRTMKKANRHNQLHCHTPILIDKQPECLTQHLKTRRSS